MRMTNAMQAALYWNRKKNRGQVLETGLSTATAAPPASSTIRLNNVAPASATIMWISYTSSLGDVKNSLLQNIFIGTVITLQSRVNGSYARYRVTSVTDNTTYVALGLTYVSGTLTFADTDRGFLNIGGTA